MAFLSPRKVIGITTLLLALSSGSAHAARTYFVRPDGSDTCSGLANTAYAGTGTSCAFRSLLKCESLAQCGDTCSLSAGDFYENSKIAMTDRCAVGNEKRIVGSSTANTVLFVGAAGELTDCTLKSGTSYVYQCSPPLGAYQGVDSGCLIQYTAGGLYLADDNVSKGTIDRYICLTPADVGQAIFVDHDATPDANLDSSNVRGLYAFNATTSKFEVRLAANERPGGQIRMWVPHQNTLSGFANAHVFYDGAAGHVLKDLTIVAMGPTAAVYVYGNSSNVADNITIENVDIYARSLRTHDRVSARNLRFKNVRVLNNYRRTKNSGCSGFPANGWCGDPPSSARQEWHGTQECVFNMSNSTIDGMTCAASREGPSFQGANLTVRNLRSHFHHNHGIKMDNYLDGAIFENIWSYNQQESLFLQNCVRNVTIKHATLPEVLIIQGASNEWTGQCPWGVDGPVNIDVYNSVLGLVDWFRRDICTNYGHPPCPVDTRAGARGHDWNYNTYIGVDPLIKYINQAGGTPETKYFTTLAEWRGWTADTCTNCTRDPNSRVSTAAAEFVNPKNHDDTLPRNYSFDLKPGAVSINAGAASHAPSDNRDIMWFLRVDGPDVGAWEYEGPVSSTCGNGTIESPEQCDGTNLGGASCTSLTGGSGTLTCASNCLFNTSGCSPAPPSDLRRTDTAPPP